MEEATESFGEAFTFKEPLGATCTLEQIWIQLESVFGLYTQQITLNREILDELVARNQHIQPQFAAVTTLKDSPPTPSSSIQHPSTDTAASMRGTGTDTIYSTTTMGMVVPPVRRDKDQGMILLSAWLNQPHLKTEVLQTFDEFCQVELFGNE